LPGRAHYDSDITIRFGLFGSAQARLGGPDVDSGAGFREFVENNVVLDQYASVAQIRERIAIFKREVKARGRIFDPMTVAVTRSVHVVMTAAEKEKAVEVRMAARRRTERLAQRPDGQNKASIMSYAMTPEAAEESALYGTPDEIIAKIQTLERLGARYVLLNSAGGPETLRRFAREVMPVFAREPLLDTVG